MALQRDTVAGRAAAVRIMPGRERFDNCLKHQLSQQEIDAAFASQTGPGDSRAAVKPFDFTRLDRIPKAQIRAVHQLHENFIRNISSSLAAYLRTNVSMNLVSMEQISYAEFLEGLSSPTFIAYLGLRPTMESR